MNRRNFIKRGALFVPTIFIPRLIRAQDLATAEGLAAFGTNAPAGGGGGNTAFITSVTGGTLVSPADFNGRVGFKFPAPASMTITDLGVRVNTGDTGLRTVYLSNEAGTVILATAVVDTTGQPANSDVTASITPVALTPAVVYQVQIVVTSGSGSYLRDNCTITTTADATISFSTYYDTAEHVNTAGVHAYGVPNFKYHL